MPPSDIHSGSPPCVPSQEPEILTKLSNSAQSFGGTDTLSFQPLSASNEDRYVVQDWQCADGIWKFAAIFDGHGGVQTVEHTIRTLPDMICHKIQSISMSGNPSAVVPQLLIETIKEFDDSIFQDLLSVFPGGPESFVTMSDEVIRSIISHDANYRKVIHCMRGTTALISLRDPCNNLWVASLGDCQAAALVLGVKSLANDWDIRILSSNHNGADKSEQERIRHQHPGEAGCISENRVLGGIAVTRDTVEALGDFLFKLPSVYTDRLFLNAVPGFRIISKVKEMSAINLTPPYVSNVADIQHVDLNSFPLAGSRFFMMCSDGLTDFYLGLSIPEMAEKWMRSLDNDSVGRSDNLAIRVFRDSLRDVEKFSQIIAAEKVTKLIDDTTIIVQKI